MIKKVHNDILEEIKNLLRENSDLRFTQALQILNINQYYYDDGMESVMIDNFYHSDEIVLRRIREQLKKGK